MRTITWTASDRTYAIESHLVDEVLPAVEARSLDNAPEWVVGLMNLRGQLIPLLDASTLLTGSPVTLRRSSGILVVRVDAQDAATMVGLMAERVLGVQTLDFSDPSAHPGLDVPESAFLGPVALADGVTVQLLEPERILGPEDRDLLFSRARASSS